MKGSPLSRDVTLHLARHFLSVQALKAFRLTCRRWAAEMLPFLTARTWIRVSPQFVLGYWPDCNARVFACFIEKHAVNVIFTTSVNSPLKTARHFGIQCLLKRVDEFEHIKRVVVSEDCGDIMAYGTHHGYVWEGMTELVMPDIQDRPLPRYLPFSLKYIRLGYHYPHDLKYTELPGQLKRLVLSANYKHFLEQPGPFDLVLPDSLETLEVRRNFQSLAPRRLPTSLKTLVYHPGRIDVASRLSWEAACTAKGGVRIVDITEDEARYTFPAL